MIYKFKDILQEANPPKSDNVYSTIQKELYEKFNYNMTNKALQICIKRNKTYFFDLDDIIKQCDVKQETNPYVVTFEMSLAEYLNIVPRNSIYRLLPNKCTNE